ncbi:signal peptidase 22 kDa subunit [Metschnikowia bicuspidata var. bicuspidata NRRL YB-4993]|uniref:Signal peptidase subunit 3 n=1 Tax=Metschnikowia bicuspidata var. bicuspidata NRRL YB-4993 TaxID=869754 RepID=A0A1A0HGC7_9ASCO|nr:signal peptidase 22 kDa subunit [Metschnikowia bicuspidata var. bicuspidata NRRL YB-4993]OBA23045.1 signal peptidase 22 kDa subunit [Metschnikowia bicuspidata var. bicuspidata NRRL YB-4993]
MFSLASRVQALSNTTLTAVSLISAIVAIISVAQLYFAGAWSLDGTNISHVKALALLKNLRSFGAEPGSAKENAKIKFDLDADLSPLFNWNTKQVFVYLTAEYDGANSGENKVTFWDKIITNKEDANLSLKSVSSKYSVWDVEPSFRERSARLKLEWNVQPWVGPLLYGQTEAEQSFQFAAAKKPKKTAR